jgi:hypothetical protein
VGAGHAVAAAAIVGGETRLSVCSQGGESGKGEERKGGSQRDSIHALLAVAAPRGNELRIWAAR